MMTRHGRPTMTTTRLAAAAGNANNNDNNNNANLNDFRKMLESSWNTNTMGEVPSTPELAAQAAATAVQNALDRNVLSMVDILLPQYDATQSDKLYDQVLAVEFCIALAKELNTKSSIIVVRDDKTIEIVSRILDRREASAAESAAAAMEEEENDDEDDEEEEVNLLDDESGIPNDDVDSFRAKLAAEWGKESSTVSEETISKRKPKRSEKDASIAKVSKKAALPPRQYRLCSMLGDAVGIKAGADMQRSVVEAIRANALPRDDEDTIIILSAASPQELVGIRALVAQYASSRNMVLVNCIARPLPRELAKAQTVYSILPLIAKPSTQGKPNPFSSGSGNNSNQSPPKVVVLRRFPRDWEIFVDTGHGFDLAATAPAESMPQKGPSMSWVVKAVKRYLETRTR